MLIVNYRDAALSLRAVDAALAALDGLAGGVTVVDDGTGDNSARSISAEVAARGLERRVRVLEAGSTANMAAGKNVGICAGLPEGQVPDYIYILHPRVRPAPAAIRAMVTHLEANPRVGIVGGSVSGPDGAVVAGAFRFPSILTEFKGTTPFGVGARLSRAAARRTALAATSGAVDCVTDTSMMLRRSALDETGLFDEDFGILYDATDLCRRARAMGWATHYLPESRADLSGPPETVKMVLQSRSQIWLDARLIYFVKNHGRAYAAAATAARLSGGLLRRLGGSRRRVDPPRFLRDLFMHDVGVALRSIWALLRSMASVGSAAAPAPGRARRR